MRHWLFVLIGFAAMAIPALSTAQPVAACPAAPDFSRYGADREAIEYARAIGQAVSQREDAPGLDRAGDLAMLLLPDLIADRVSTCAEPAMSPASQPAICNAEARRALSAYLTTAIPADQLRDVWSFLAPRAGPIPPSDPSVPLAGWRFNALSSDGLPLRYNLVLAPPHIDNRRERAWQYLQHHRSGEAVMSAVSQFIQSRQSDGRGEAAICPVTHAEAQRQIGQLAQP